MTLKLVPLILLYIVSICKGQEGFFEQDNVQLGTPLKYCLIYQRPSAEIVQFPNETYDFSPFQLLGLHFKPTQTVDNISYDTVCYELMAFENDTIQSLRLPILIKRHNRYNEVYWDSVFTPLDSVKISFTVPEEEVQQRKLKPDISFKVLEDEFNYPFLILFVILIFVLGLLVYIFLGKMIARKIRIWRLKKRHKQFILTYDRLIYDSLNMEDIKAALALSKRYLSELEGLPLVTYTTKEMGEYFQDQHLTQILNQLDRIIYSQNRTAEEVPTLEGLRDFCLTSFNRTLAQTKAAPHS